MRTAIASNYDVFSRPVLSFFRCENVFLVAIFLCGKTADGKNGNIAVEPNWNSCGTLSWKPAGARAIPYGSWPIKSLASLLVVACKYETHASARETCVPKRARLAPKGNTFLGFVAYLWVTLSWQHANKQ